MTKHNSANERIKRGYFVYLREARRRNDASIDGVGEKTCKTPEEFKAWSQNLGHEKVLTTFTSYGEVAPHRQATLIRGLSAMPGDVPPSQTLEARLKRLEAALAPQTVGAAR